MVPTGGDGTEFSPANGTSRTHLEVEAYKAQLSAGYLIPNAKSPGGYAPETKAELLRQITVNFVTRMGYWDREINVRTGLEVKVWKYYGYGE